MPIFDQLEINKKIPLHKDYRDMVQRIEFYEQAVEVDAKYWDTLDTNGNSSLRPFTCEIKGDIKWRKTVSNPTNFMGSILNKYLSSSFKEKPERPDNEFYDNVDLLGSSMQEFIEIATKKSLIDGVCYILPDSTSQDTSLSELQKQVIGVRPFLRLIEAVEVPNWSEYLGHLQEIIIELEDADENTFYMYYDNQNMSRIDVTEKGIITSISDLVPHGYDRIPVVRLLPFDTEESFIAPGANLQLSINNLKSLEKVELYKSTFTRYFLSGIKLNTDEQGNPIPYEWGNDRVIATESTDASMTVLGSDTAQAASIRESIKQETEDLYKTYHISATQTQESGQAPSGYSILLSRADFSSICGQIVKAAENTENNLVLLLNQTETLGIEPVVYPRNFIDVNEGEEITKLRDILSLDLDDASKQIARERFVSKFLKKE